METVALIGSDLPAGATDPITRLNGARLATAEALAAILRFGTADRYDLFQVADQPASPDAYLAELAGHGIAVERVRLVPLAQVRQALSSTPYLALHDPSAPDLARLVAMARPVAPEALPCSCRCHSLSYANLLPVFMAACSVDVDPSDAIFCSSSDARAALHRLFDHLNATFMLPEDRRQPRLELVPLGLDASSYAPAVPPAAARQLLGLPPAGRYVAYVGRLSPFDKADLDVLLRAVATLARSPGYDDLRLLLAGDDTQRYSNYLRARAQALSIGRAVHVLTNLTESAKRLALWSADVFVSPVDSVQESFGLAVLEAMAAGLPGVVSDWGGYRDLVTDGDSGLLVPTIWGPCTSAVETQAELGSFMADHVLLAQGVVVDEEALTDRLRRLLEDAELRASMGQRAQEQARGYDWPLVVRRYEAVWRQLKQEALQVRVRDRSPARFPFYEVFGHYATRRPRPEDVVERRPDGAPLPPAPVPLQLLVPEAVIHRLLSMLAGAPQTVSTLVRTETDLLGLLWLAKSGAVRIRA